jgi:hypothetical protein
MRLGTIAASVCLALAAAGAGAGEPAELVYTAPLGIGLGEIASPYLVRFRLGPDRRATAPDGVRAPHRRAERSGRRAPGWRCRSRLAPAAPATRWGSASPTWA